MKQPLSMQALGVLCLITSASFSQPAQTPAPDLILLNGKIITVDDRFTLAQAVAIQGDRIVAVGSNQAIAQLSGPEIKRIDLAGRTVIPGLIDNHMHLLRAGLTWSKQVRWDGVETRKDALELLRARLQELSPGEWAFTLGGWTLDQFQDNREPFTREELDEVAPHNPVLLQAAYYQTYLNSRALQLLGIDQETPTDDWVLRGPDGRPTGVIEEAGVRVVARQLPAAAQENIEASTLDLIQDMNRAGLTAFGSAGCAVDLLDLYQELAGKGRLNLRVFCIDDLSAETPEQAHDILPQIAQIKLFQGDNSVDNIFYGESVYRPLHDRVYRLKSYPKEEQLTQWRMIATEIAQAGLPLQVHAGLKDSIDAFLDQIERIHQQYPVKNLRWVLAHVDQLDASQLKRMKELGISAAVHPRTVISGGILHRVHGQRAYEMPALRTIQDSGIKWGLGSDGPRANQYLPFETLGWAITGRMVGGRQVTRQTLSREEALIAHTRKNAYLVFQENNLGSIQAGKLADLVVLDRDYLTIPADQIKDIQPVLTMVGGRIVYDAVGVW